MFDEFEAFKSMKKQEFSFQPTRYEMWIGGKMVADGKTNSLISAKVIKQNDLEKIEISFIDRQLNDELSNKNIFDEFVTGNDRLRLITVPNETNVENIGIAMLKMHLGITRQSKNFNRNEPIVDRHEI